MITKEPEDKKAHNYHIQFFNAARTGFEHLLRSLNGKKILMPAYIGETETDGTGVFEPIRNTKIPFGFYSLNQQLKPDINEIETKLKSGDYGAFLLIHYFGFVQCDPEKVKELCEKYSVVFIEDCAHTWCSTWKGKQLGTIGDYGIFSIHKLVPTDHGGFLLLNKPLKEPAEKTANEQDVQTFLTSNWDKINKTRISNYHYYLKELRNIKEIEIMYPELQEGIIPLNFPILIKNNLREKLYFKMKDKEVITIALYYQLIPEIKKEEHPTAYEVSNSILNLPVHQDITQEDAEKVVKVLKESLQELS